MGGVCSKKSSVDKSPSDTLDPNGRRNQSTTNQPNKKTQGNAMEEAMEKQLGEQPLPGNSSVTSADATEPQFSTSASQTSRLTNSRPCTFGKSGTAKVSSCDVLISFHFILFQVRTASTMNDLTHFPSSC